MELRTTFAVVVSAAIAATALTAAAPAHADVSTYLDTLHALGFSSSDAVLLRNGEWICRALNAGYSPIAVAEYIYTHTDFSINRTDAENVVRVAIADLCGSTGSAGPTV